jgi:hypothetical protein
MSEYDEPTTGGRAWAREAAVVLDPLLADIWSFRWAAESEAGEPVPVEVLLRMAYLQGYQDALGDPVRGAVLRRLGVVVPAARRTARNAPRTPRAKGSPGSSGT